MLMDVRGRGRKGAGETHGMTSKQGNQQDKKQADIGDRMQSIEDEKNDESRQQWSDEKATTISLK